MMKKNCESCGGSGQISYFKGVSRFLLSTEDCPECAGMGFLIVDDEEDVTKGAHSDKKKMKKEKS